MLAVTSKEVTTDIGIQPIATQDRGRTPHFCVESCIGLFDGIVPDQPNSATVQNGIWAELTRKHVIRITDRDISVNAVIDVTAERFKAQSNLLIRFCVAVVEVEPDREADNSVEPFHPVTPACPDGGSTATIVGDHPHSMHEQDCVLFELVGSEHPDVAVACIVPVQPPTSRVDIDSWCEHAIDAGHPECRSGSTGNRLRTEIGVRRRPRRKRGTAAKRLRSKLYGASWLR